MTMQPKATDFAADEMFLTAAQVAQRYGVSESTLANHRAQGTGLPYIKINGSVRYAASVLLANELAGARGLSWDAVRKGLAAAGLEGVSLENALAGIRNYATRD